MMASGIIMTFAPFVDWGRFLPNPQARTSERTKVELASGEQANINTFEINSSQVVIYPKTNDPVLNEEAFRTWQLIRLPLELGGEKMMCLPSDCTAWSAFTSGACGSTGRRKAGRGANAPAMAACTIR
jgi:hypothetical protein